MKHRQLRFPCGFRVTFSTRRAQVAEMVIAPGDAEGALNNRHRDADQWLYVVSGTGVARVAGRRIGLRQGVLILIRHRESHEIRNTGRAMLKTLNFYTPPAYTHSGKERPAARPN